MDLSPISSSPTKNNEYFDDLLRVTKGNTDEALARLVIRSSELALPWMQSQGVRFQPSLSGTLSLGRTNAFFLGGGKALVNAYYNRATDLGVAVLYDTKVTRISIERNQFTGVDVETTNGPSAHQHITGRAVVLASGGFQSDLEWLSSAWGPAAKNFLIRGTPFYYPMCC